MVKLPTANEFVRTAVMTLAVLVVYDKFIQPALSKVWATAPKFSN